MEKQIKLFCIPYAGGKAEMFRELAGYLPDRISVIPLEYAGHGTRAKEAFYADFTEMTTDIASKIEKQLDGNEDFALFGYSMGSLVAYEIVARKLLKKQPEHLFLASHEAPGMEWESKGYSEMDDVTFAKAIVAFGGFDRFEERFLENRHFRRMIFDPIRQDYRLITSYHWEETERLSVPGTLFFAPDDVPVEKAEQWRLRFHAPLELIEIGKNHFFIKDEPEKLAGLIRERMERIDTK